MTGLALDLDLFLSAFVTFFVLIDPIGVAPIFAGLTRGFTSGRRWRQAARGVAIALAVLLFFALAGEWLLERLGITMPAFSTAGGILLLMIGIEMIMEQRTPRRDRAARRLAEPGEHAPSIEETDVSVFPLAVPLLAGPGAIATIILMGSANPEPSGTLAVLGAVVLVLAVTFIALGALAEVLERTSDQIAVLLTRLMGILLAAMSVQFIFNGVKAGLLSG